MLAIWSPVSLPFLKPAWTSGSSRFTFCWSLAWRILSITLPACEMSAIMWYFEHLGALPSFGIGMKTDCFQSCGHYWVFQICWHIECSTFTASSFRIWKSSTGIGSLPLALFIVLLSKAHLTSHSRMSGLSEWSHHHDYLGHEDLFCIVLCILAPLYNIFCFCQVHTVSVLYRAHLFMKCSLGIPNFLEEISSLSHSIAFLYFFALITEEGFLISLCYSLELCIQMSISFLFSIAFHFSFLHS